MKRISLICICTTFIVLQGIDRIQNAKASDTSSPILIPVSNPAEGETAPKNHSRKGVRPLPPAEAGEKSGTSLKWKSSLNVAADKNIASREIITTDLYAADPTEENNVSGGEKEPAGAKFARKMPIDDPDAKAEKSSEAPPLLETDSDGDDDQETADSEESSEDSDAEKATEEDEEDAGEKAEESDDQPASETQPSDETFVPEVAQKVTLDPNSVGNPHSAALVRMMYDEIMNGLSQRGISGRYDMFRSYARSTLDRFAANSTGNEVDGRCRLSWYDRLYRDPVRAVFEVEQFSRTLHAGLKGDHRHLGETLKLIRNKLDIPARNDEIRYAQARTPQQAVAEVKRCLENAQSAYARALSTLTLAEQKELGSNLYPVFCANTINGHTIPSRSSGRRLVGIIEKMDRTGIHEALEALIPLTDEKFLRLLATLPEDAFPTVLLGSQRVQRIPTAAGDILIGGRENNVYDLDAPGMQDVACVIDLGGNDIYRDGTCNINRPVFVVIDLAGNDQYIATKPGVQGGSVLGVSMLLDLEGDDVYKAQDVAQGSTLGGAGLLIDYSGDDTYLALRRAQGCALGGVGVLIDRKGNDKYRAALLAQGLGHPGGFGVLEDSQGDDWYYLGGLYLDSYPEHPGYDGWGQGLGAGIRQVANGGIGSLLDGGGTTPTNSITSDTAAAIGSASASAAISAETTSTSGRRCSIITANREAKPVGSGSATVSVVIIPSDSASTTKGTTCTTEKSWASEWPGTCRSVSFAISAGTTNTRRPAE